MSKIDVVGDAEAPTIGDNALKNISGLADKMLELIGEVVTLEETLIERKKELFKIQEGTLPEAMDGVGMKKFTLAADPIEGRDDDHEILIKDNTRASITEKNQKKAFAWLNKNGHGDIIKRVITLKFGRGQEKDFKSVMRLKTVQKFEPAQKESVHTGTLTSLVKELTADGKRVPEKLLSVYRGRIAKVK